MTGYTIGTTSYSSSSACQAVPGVVGAVDPGNGQPTFGPNVVKTISLPNGQQYTLNYDSVTGFVNKIIYPSGGYVSYTWGTNPRSSAVGYNDGNGNLGACAYLYDTPAISQRTVSFDGSTIALQQNFSYSTAWNITNPGGNQEVFGSWATKTTTVTTQDFIAGTTSKTVYTYGWVVGQPPISYMADNSNGISDQLAVENTTQYYGYAPSYPLLRTETKNWQISWPPPLACSAETLDNGQASSRLFAYGAGGQITDIKEYDYGQVSSSNPCLVGVGSPPTPARETVTAYQSFASTPIFATGPSIFDRPSTVITKDSGGNRASETDYSYDQSTITSVSNLPTGSHDETSYGSSSTAPRGNATTITKQCFQGSQTCTSGNPSTTLAYDETGQPLTSTDPNGHITQFSYADSYTVLSGGQNISYAPSGNTNAYLTKITNPLSQTQNFTYDFNNGQLTASKDPNNRTTTYVYNDSLARPTLTTRPDGGTTTISYNDAPYNPQTPSPSVTATVVATPDPSVVTLAAFDGLGHTVRSVFTSDPDCSSGDRTNTTYDGLSRVYTVSNPYCSTSDPTYGLTTYAYDALGRTTQVTHPDNSTILTTYTGRATQVQDEGNGTRRVTRISQVDGLDRLTSVCEVTSASQLGSTGTPAACGQDISATGFLTTYGYDALGNLTSVSQNGLNGRSFQYDSLSRLTSASNPESGTITYKYDLDTICASPNSFSSLLVSKTDARGIRTCMQYDALNRITQKNYSDSTPTAFFAYEQTSSWGVTLTNTVGRLTEQWTGTSCCATVGAEIFSYDQMGRPLLNEQFTPSMGYVPLNYTYDLAGDMASFTNGGGETFSYTMNGAARLTTLTSSLSDSNHPGTLFSGAHYNAAGSLLSASLSNVITETRTYDPRLRLASISDGSNYSLTIPSSGGYAPNGDVLAANDSVNGNWTYSYDDFNRLSGSNQNSGQSVYSYVYDRFGNRWQQNGPNSMQLSFSGANNRMDGYSYDAAGNVLNDGSHQYFYDAESRLIQVDGTLGTCSTATACYGYDAEGRRVEKTTSSGTASYIYDLAGHQVVQYGPNCSPCRDEIYAGGRHLATYNNSTTYFIHPDWLGTERARSNVSGALCETITSGPFGDGQSTSGSCSDISPTHFTGKPRDTESNLDYFGARYNASSFGRFVSPDPLLNSGKPWEPQSWNRYSYTLNNPLTFTDPNGLWTWGFCANASPEQCEDYADRFRDSVNTAKEALKNLDPNSKEAKKLKKALDKLGEEGKGSAKVSFGALGQDEKGNLILGYTKRNKITIDYGNVDDAANGRNMNDSEAAALDAGVATHEGAHLGYGPFGIIGFRGEHEAYYTESVLYQGLHNTDRANGLWNESWLTVDQHLFPVGKTREQAVQHNLHPDKVPAPVVPPPGGQQ